MQLRSGLKELHFLKFFRNAISCKQSIRFLLIFSTIRVLCYLSCSEIRFIWERSVCRRQWNWLIYLWRLWCQNATFLNNLSSIYKSLNGVPTWFWCWDMKMFDLRKEATLVILKLQWCVVTGNCCQNTELTFLMWLKSKHWTSISEASRSYSLRGNK